MYTNRKTRVFTEKKLRDYLETKRSSIIKSIETESEDYLLNVDSEKYIEHKVSEAIVEPLEIFTDEIEISPSKKDIPWNHFPNTIYVVEGKSYEKDIIVVHVPFSGNPDLFSCQPDSCIMWSVEVELHQNEFTFEIVNFRNDVTQINREKNETLDTFSKQVANVRSQVERFNSNLCTYITNFFDQRKEKILEKNGLLASLGVPIRKSGSTSSTFSIPSPKLRKKVRVQRPSVNEAGFQPEPTLNETVYFDILQLIHDVGREFERLPRLYAEKEEEHLRDHFLMMLEPHYEGSATGETFNKTGKTDILLRHNGTNVFIAECKFWHGSKGFLATISQLLGYLSWRDSKAAVVMFVQNKDFTSVLETAKQCIDKHANYISLTSERDETWYNYMFHLNEDSSRKVKLATMFYHMPIV